MISYFNSGYLIRYLVVFIISIAIWLPSFILPQIFFEPRSVFSLFQFDKSLIENYSMIFILIIYFLTLITALALNQILREYDLIGVNNTSGFAVYVIFVSALPLFTSINIFIAINLLLVIFTQNLLRLSTVEDPVSIVFNASFLLGVASVFFVPLLYLVVLIWIAVFINRKLDLRGFIISIVGIALPYLFIFTWFYWNNTALANGKDLLYMLSYAGFSLQMENFNLFSVALLSLIALIIITAFFVSMSRINEKGSFVRKNFIIGVYYMLIATSIVFIYYDDPQNLLLLGLPAALIVSSAVFTLKKSRLFNIFFAFLFIGVLLYHYYQLFNAKEIFFR